MDKIILSNMKFFGYHGVLHTEQEQGQYFFVDAELLLELCEAGRTDELEKTIDYGQVFQTVRRIVEAERYKLIEALAERIAGAILDDHPAAFAVTVEVRKPGAPIDGHFDHMGVRIERERKHANG